MRKGGASEAAEKLSNAVILSEAKDPGSSREWVNRANYRGSSPKGRAQNDSASAWAQNESMSARTRSSSAALRMTAVKVVNLRRAWHLTHSEPQ